MEVYHQQNLIVQKWMQNEQCVMGSAVSAHTQLGPPRSVRTQIRRAKINSASMNS
jgi:hypothetical protein